MASPFDSRHDAVRARIIYYADRYSIDRDVAIWQIWQESKFDPNAVSPAGAKGIAQFMPATASRFGVNVFDVESSLNGWGQYMRAMLDMFGGRVDLALAGYNSGENRNEYKAAARENRQVNWSVMPSGVQTETQNYVRVILANSGGSSVSPAPAGSSKMLLYGFGFVLLFLLIDD